MCLISNFSPPKSTALPPVLGRRYGLFKVFELPVRKTLNVSYFLGIMENLRWFFEEQNHREENAKEYDVNLRHKQHSIRCFAGNEQDIFPNRRTSEQRSNDDSLPQLIVHFHSALPAMSVFLSGLIQEFARLLFDIEVEVQPQSATAAKILSFVKSHSDCNKVLSTNKPDKSKTADANNNSPNNVSGNFESSMWPNANDINHGLEKESLHYQKNRIKEKNIRNINLNFSVHHNDAYGKEDTDEEARTNLRKRRIAESGSNSASDKENIYKFTVRLNCRCSPNEPEIPLLEESNPFSPDPEQIDPAICKRSNAAECERFFSLKLACNIQSKNKKISFLHQATKSQQEKKKVVQKYKSAEDYVNKPAKRAIICSKSLDPNAIGQQNFSNNAFTNHRNGKCIFSTTENKSNNAAHSTVSKLNDSIKSKNSSIAHPPNIQTEPDFSTNSPRQKMSRLRIQSTNDAENRKSKLRHEQSPQTQSKSINLAKQLEVEEGNSNWPPSPISPMRKKK